MLKLSWKNGQVSLSPSQESEESLVELLHSVKQLSGDDEITLTITEQIPVPKSFSEINSFAIYLKWWLGVQTPITVSYEKWNWQLSLERSKVPLQTSDS